MSGKDPAAETRIGVAYALAAYLSWSLIVFYFKAVAHVPPLEVLAHRVAFSAVLLWLWLGWRGRLGAVRTALRDRRTAAVLLATTVLIAINWLVFIVAVFEDRVIEGSLGYFINPLVSVLLGAVVLGERLRPRQMLSVVLAALGVLYLTLSFGRPPWLALILASTFGLYGLLRKTTRADATVGLAIETWLLVPVAVIYLGWLATTGRLVFGHLDRTTDILLPVGGLVTALPLVWFANGVRRLRLATIGLLQYLAPTGQLLIGVLVFGEAFTRVHATTFLLIWSGLALYSIDAFLHARPGGSGRPARGST